MPSRPLLVATAGGHLTQLMALARRMPLDVTDALWVTMDTPQSRSALAGRDVLFVPYGAPRDVGALARHSAAALSAVCREKFSVAISTGANVAPPFLAAARLRGVPSHFVDSATRFDGPSYAGRLCRRIPGVHLYTQYEHLTDQHWHYGGNTFESFTTEAAPAVPIRRAVVSVGSARDFPFPAMVRAVQAVLPTDCEVLWQIGDTPADGLGGRVVAELPSNELAAELASSDVVICHAGTGSAFAALSAGRCPVLIPRSASRNEHVDDHQSEIAAMLAGRGLAVVASPEALTGDDLRRAAHRRAVHSVAPPFRLAA